jgi:hypothetical protein
VSTQNLLPQNILIRQFRFAAPAFGIALCMSCARQSPAPTQFVPQLSYSVTFITGDSLHVSATIACDRGTSLQKILFPPFDADNPELAFFGNNIHNVTLSGAAVESPLSASTGSAGAAQEMLVRTDQAIFTLTYDVTFPYGPNANGGLRTLLPGVQGTNDWYYQGNYIFCVPEFGATKPDLWRKNVAVAIDVATPANRTAYGVLSGHVALYTVYELFFLQFSISDRGQPCDDPTANIVVLSSRQPQPDFSSLVCKDLFATAAKCAEYFPALLSPKTVFFQDSGSGLEGTYSFFMMNWTTADYSNAVRHVVPHEALHWWVGIRTGDLDDPWWKEATAQYLGLLIAGSFGFSKDVIRPLLVLDLSGNPMVARRAMSDPYVRDNLYNSDTSQSCVKLVYFKGAQVNMILDKMIRQATNNRATLFSLTGSLCTQYDHGAFSRDGFKAHMEQGTGLDLSGFFSQYVESPGALDTNIQAQTFAWLDSAGAFTGKP